MQLANGQLCVIRREKERLPHIFVLKTVFFFSDRVKVWTDDMDDMSGT